MYPVEVRKEGRNIENGTVIAFTGRVRLNAAFAAVMRENNVTLDEIQALRWFELRKRHPRNVRGVRGHHSARVQAFSPISKSNVTLSSAASWTRPRRCWGKVARSSTSCPKARQAITVLDALAGNKEAADALKDAHIPEIQSVRRRPHGEYEIGDVDNTVRYAAQLAVSWHSIFVDSAISGTRPNRPRQSPPVA